MKTFNLTIEDLIYEWAHLFILIGAYYDRLYFEYVPNDAIHEFIENEMR